jgi:hypothetical protein
MSKTSRSKEPRKRGAPKGSQNATKHTCDCPYTAQSPAHRTEPQHHTDLQSEIEALKEQFWYFHRQFQSTSDPKTKKSASKSSNQVMDRLVEAVRCQHKAFPPEDPRLAAMRLTSDVVTKDWACLDPYRCSPDIHFSSSAPHDPPEEHPPSQTSPGGAGPPPYGRGA